MNLYYLFNVCFDRWQVTCVLFSLYFHPALFIKKRAVKILIGGESLKNSSFCDLQEIIPFSFNKIFHSEKKIIETRYSIVRKKRLVRGHSHFKEDPNFPLHLPDSCLRFEIASASFKITQTECQLCSRFILLAIFSPHCSWKYSSHTHRYPF